MEHDSNFRNFHVIKGGLQKKAQTASYRLISAWITDTRLMGVCCIKAHWLAEAGDDTFEMFQFFYFDWQEYGLETYESFLGEPDLEMLEAVETVEHSLASGLGGKKTLSQNANYAFWFNPLRSSMRNEASRCRRNHPSLTSSSSRSSTYPTRSSIP